MSETAKTDTESATETEAASEGSKPETTASKGPPQAQPAQFDPLHDSSQAADSDLNLDVILDVGVTMSMEVGRVRIPIRNLLQLSQGSVVELDRLAGEPLDVFVNGTLIAHGEVVMVNEKFGVRLTDVVSPAERIRKLR
ncbi:flagellar motor switch protein FliN [Algiphilus aromaticivorans]|uniref:flagellar motor switch protein FliN n=1 Tax=Algiphilus aromaticivorans TaxID=382454 RepID=UPI000A062A48|nr:flagellar motor switch protein FliN [Algiphilus aromaticivorans]